MRRPSRRSVGLVAGGFFAGMLLVIATDEPEPTQPIFGFTKYEKSGVRVVEKELPVAELPKECEDLVGAILRFHKAAHAYSEVNGKAEDLIVEMRGYVAGGDIETVDKLAKEYDALMVDAFGNNIDTGVKGPGADMALSLEAIKHFSVKCRSATQP